MELPKLSDLTTKEATTRIEISPTDPCTYPAIYYMPFGQILEFAHRIPPGGLPPDYLPMSLANWDLRYGGYCDWAVPTNPDESRFEKMTRAMQTQCIYGVWGESGLEYPEKQMNKMFSVPYERQLTAHSATSEHKALETKIFVLKYSLAPYATSHEKKNSKHHLSDTKVRVWRLLSCFGETTLATLHDRILAPSMGWSRHYHSYKFLVPTSGACFGPQESGAVDMMHTGQAYTLDDTKYLLCHILRKTGQRLVYIYDLGDGWVHNIELIQIADPGERLKPSSDAQITEALIKRYPSTHINVTQFPKLTGVELFVGELNCPPEDSNGCDMGNYGSLLKKGRNYNSRDASLSVNWRDHYIKNAYKFDLDAHAKRLADAIHGKGSAKIGQKHCTVRLTPGTHSEMHHLPTGVGQKHLDRCLASTSLGNPGPCAPISEVINIRPDKRDEAVCAKCGRQPNFKKGAQKLMCCAQCKAARYCGSICQRSDWKRHKVECNKLKRERHVYKDDKKKELSKKKKKSIHILNEKTRN